MPSSSGTYNFFLSNSEIVFEAFSRIQWSAPQITREMLVQARNSINLELLDWSTRGVNLWEVVPGTINLVVDTPTYVLPTTIVTLLDVYFTQVNGGGAGINTDRIMVPINRDDYAAIPNKLSPGTPTQYWYQRLEAPQITVWQNPNLGAPDYVINWFGLQRVQDANLGGGETPDVPYKAMEALASGLCARLAEKYRPAQHQAKLKLAAAAWGRLATIDQEMGPVIMQPNVSGYTRI